MSVLNIDVSNKFQIQTQTLVGRSVAVLGITGSGKTNTAAVLIEELLLSGLPLTVVDIEGEYWGLKEKFEVLVAGRSPHAELEVSANNATQLAEISVRRGISVILDLSDFLQDEATEFLTQYFTSLWAVSTSTRQPYQIVLEEAHEFLPQGTRTPLKQILTRIALRGRKRGLGIILVSQRSAKVEKDVLTQTSLLFLHKVVHPIDLKVYRDLIPLSTTQVEDMIRKLQPGEAAVVYNHQVYVIHIRPRHTFHVGSTPMYDIIKQPKLRKIDEAMLRELNALVVNVKGEESNKDERARLIQQVKELEDLVLSKDTEIQRLRDRVELLSKLSISIGEFPNKTQIANGQTLAVEEANTDQVVDDGEKSRFMSLATKDLISGSKVKSVALSALPLTSMEQRKLNFLIRRIQKLSKLHRSILRLLTEHEGTTMTISMIASWLSLQENTIRSHPPHDLMKMGLITRVRGQRGYKYSSAVSSFLKTEFPHLEPEFLLRALFE